MQYIYALQTFTIVKLFAMKYVLFFIICCLCATTSLAQDGNVDIRYIKLKKLNKSYIGSFVHLVFAKQQTGKEDTVLFAIDNRFVPFVAHFDARVQGGLFYAQYWQSTVDVLGYNLRLVCNRIDAVTADSIQLTSYFDSYTKNGGLAAGNSIQQQYWFGRKAIAGLLVKVSNGGL